MLESIIGFLKEKGEMRMTYKLLDTFFKYANKFGEYEALAKGFYDIKEYSESIKCAEMMLLTAPNTATLCNVRLNLANMHNKLNEPEKALSYLALNTEVSPLDPETLLETAFSLGMLDRRNEAEVILRRLSVRPDLQISIRNRVEYSLGTYKSIAEQVVCKS